MNRLTLLPVLSFTIFLFSSCKTSKQLAYFKDLPQDESVTKIQTAKYQPLRLQPDDELQITISSASAEASQFFNMVASMPMSSVSGVSLPGAVNSGGASQVIMNMYRVNQAGQITLPVLKDIQATGLTTDDLKNEITQLLSPYLKDPVVIIKLMNFKVTVIGEVSRPVVVPVSGQTINVLEAIGAAGDMTAFGIRKNVKVLRKLPDGTTEIAILNFNKSDVLQSPYFQLRQNDVVYIQPNKGKGLIGSQTGIFVSVITSIASLTAIILTRKF